MRWGPFRRDKQPSQPSPEGQSQPKKDAPDMILERWKELNLEKIQGILEEETGWLDEYLKAKTEYKKTKEEIIDSLKKAEKRENLIEILGELERKEKITNLFGLVYIPDDYTIIAVTDIHGDVDALQKAINEFTQRKQKKEKVAFVCMGDFVDRGEYSFEVVKALFDLKRKYGDEVIIMKADHEDHIEVDETEKEPASKYKIVIDPAEFTETLIESAKKAYDPNSTFDPVEDLLLKTFSKLPYGVIWREIIFTHGGLPIKIDPRFKQEETRETFNERVLKEAEQLKLGDFIDLRTRDKLLHIYWDDITDENQPDTMKGTRGVGEYRIPFSLLSKVVQNLGFRYLIRGHQYEYLKEQKIAVVQQENIITFHSNQSFYTTIQNGYEQGCYLVLNPDGSIVAKSVSSEDSQVVIGPQKTKAELPSEVEQQREIEAESLKDRIESLLQSITQEYGEFINLVVEKPNEFNEELRRIIEEEIRPKLEEQKEQKAIEKIFAENEEALKEIIRRYIGLLLLSNASLLGDESKKKKVEEFLEKKFSIDDLIYFITKADEVQFKERKFKIQNEWKVYLQLKLIKKLEKKEDLEKYLKALINVIERKRDLLIENYAKKYQKEGLDSKTAREQAEKYVNEFIERLKEQIPTIVNLPQEQLELLLGSLKKIAEEVEKAKEEEKKEEEKEQKWQPILENLQLAGGLLVSGFFLWLAFLGFFAPLWLIEKARKEIKI